MTTSAAMADAINTALSLNGTQHSLDVEQPTLNDNAVPPRNGNAKPPRAPSRSQQLNKLYSLPAPLRTFPLPTFVPHNPISLFHILYTWISQTVQTPSSHPESQYQAWYSVETRSVHVTDSTAVRALWEQGFYGKGNLSRSEPSWLDRERRRTGANAKQTSEEVTRQRRAERQQVKWERARKEREAIDEKLLEESGHALSSGPCSVPAIPQQELSWPAPVGPLEILKLPNSADDISSTQTVIADSSLQHDGKQSSGEIGHVMSQLCNGVNGHVSSEQQALSLPTKIDLAFNSATNGALITGDLSDPSKSPKSQKSVRFSPTVEQTTFLPSEPPSPDLAATSVAQADEAPLDIKDREHLQLTMEEAFFLSYGLGVLTVLDRKTKSVIPTKELFSLGRQSSYFPPSDLPLLSPDDSFMLSYIVYHHFRSLGWVVRGGTKFSVDYLLYNRGPVFSHAEFAILILPSYSDPYWSSNAEIREYVSKKETRRWSWVHCVNRVNSQVKKTLVLVYVDIPPPLALSEEEFLGIDGILKRYKVREIILKRWLSNRSRD